MGRPRHASTQITRLVGHLAREPATWRYGYELAIELEISSGTLYPALARLADDGLLEHRWSLPDRGERPRHLYRLTSQGATFAARLAAGATPARTRAMAAPRLAAP